MTSRLKTFLAVLLLLLSGCAGGDRLANVPPDQLYRMAEAAGADGDYVEAEEILERIRDSYPFSRYAVDAELLSADLKFDEEKFEEAAALYRSFEQLHPTHPRVDYAIHQRGMAYWELSRPSDRDQSNTRAAAEAFQKLLYGYPDSELAGATREQLAAVRSRLAAHEIHVGKYYLRRKSYAAAAARLEGVVREYPDTPQRDEALSLALEAKAKLAESTSNPE